MIIDTLNLQPEVSGIHRLRELFYGKKIIGIFLLLSILIHILFLVKFNGMTSTVKNHSNTSKNTTITLTNYIPEQRIKASLNPEKSPIEKTTIADSDNNIKKVISNQQNNDKKIVKKSHPIVEKKTEYISEVNQPENNTEISTSRDSALLSSIKEQYLHNISSHLDKHKFYPRAARRRHLEGDVNISFDLLVNGSIADLKISSGHSALKRAAYESISSALPLPSRPTQLALLETIKINYSMKFSLLD